MSKLEKRIHDAKNGLDYVFVGDCYIPALIFPEESRPIGKWGRMHRAYLKERHPGRYSALLLSGKLETYLADLTNRRRRVLRLSSARISSNFCANLTTW